jgi:hypothetical protein
MLTFSKIITKKRRIILIHFPFFLTNPLFLQNRDIYNTHSHTHLHRHQIFRMSQSHDKSHNAVIEFIETSIKLRIKKKILDQFYTSTNNQDKSYDLPILVKDINILYYMKHLDNLKEGECLTISYKFPYWFYHVYKYFHRKYAIIEKEAKIIRIYDLTFSFL